MTAVIGAGPAGLLFSLVSRLLHKARGGRSEQWPVLLFDMRTEYVRTHRLRLDPAPFRELERELGDAQPMRDLLAFLEEHDYSTPANLLERRLASLVEREGIRRELLQFGGPTAPDLKAFRRFLVEGGRLGDGDRLSVVAADSVHSAVRKLVKGDAPSFKHAYSAVARLILRAPELPEKLGQLEHYRLSKLLGSVLDYTLNPNGFAEVDLFLTLEEHRRVQGLGATPETPVVISEEVLAGAKTPLFRKIVGYFQRRLGQGCEVSLFSTFRHQHRYISRVAFQVPDIGAVFLVGDAAVSLPFFRGMACATACVHSLAKVQCDLFQLGDARKTQALLDRYNVEVQRIRDREVLIVNSRARIIRLAREFARVSAMLPFPLQTWLVNAEQPEWGGKATPDLVANLIVAASAAAMALLGLFLESDWIWLSLSAIALQTIGGAFYAAALTWKPLPNPGLRIVWLIQMSILMIVGPAYSLVEFFGQGRFAAFPLVFWFILGLAFATGLLVTDRSVAWFRRDL